MMQHDPCDRLDEFLAGDLTGQPRDEFERHLVECSQCRDEAESFARLAGIMQAAEQRHVRCPPTLPVRIRQAVSRGRLRWRIAVAAAAIVFVAIAGSVWLVTGRSGPSPADGGRQDLADRGPGEERPAAPVSEVEADASADRPPPGSETPARRSAMVSVEFSDDVIGVPIETDDPSVTILWMYPTLGQVAGND